MILLEKIQATGLNTDIAPDAIEKLGGDRKIINPIIDCLNKRYISSDNGSAYKWENIKGTIQKNISLPSGTNKCIGAYEDYINNQVIYWIANSGNNDCIIAYDPEADSSAILLGPYDLNFPTNGKKISAGVIGQLLHWTDASNNMFAINLTRDYSYTGFDVSHILLIKTAPRTKPTIGTANYSNDPRVSRTYDPTIFPEQNRIYNKNFQFAYRYKYLDNEYSVLSPFSDVSYGEYYPIKLLQNGPDYLLSNIYSAGAITGSLAGPPIKYTTEIQRSAYNYANKIKVSIPLPDAADKFIKQAEVLVRENNTGNWKLWRTYKSDEFVPIFSSISFDPLVDYFLNTEVLIDIDQTETSKIFESIPNFSSSECIHKNRIFAVDDEEGFDVLDEPDLTLANSSYTALGVANYNNNGYSTLGTLSTEWFATSTSFFTANLGLFDFVLTGPSAQANTIGSRVFIRNTSTGTVLVSGIVVLATNGGSLVTVNVDIIYSGTGSSASSWSLRSVLDTYKTYWKSRGVFTIGLAVFDAQMRSMGIVSKKTIQIPDASYPGGGSPAYFLQDNLLSVNIAGDFSNTPKAKYFSLCSTEDQFVETFHQSLVEILFYKFDAPDGYTPDSTEYIYNDKVFYKVAPSAGPFVLYFRTPKEFPVVLDNNWSIHLKSVYEYFNGKDGGIYDSGVIGIDGDLVKTNSDFGIGANDPNLFLPYWIDTSTESRRNYFVKVEFYKKRESSSDIFYEITSRLAINNGILSQTSFTNLQGQSYVLDHLVYTFNKLTSPITVPGNAYPPYLNAVPMVQKAMYALSFFYVETLSRISTNTLDTNFLFPSLPSKIVTTDYQKISWNKGKPFQELIDKIKQSFTSVIRFSNTYVQDTAVNGLNSFDTGNKHTVSLDRGPITKLVPLLNNILSIHEWASTTLYTEEGLLRSADDGSTLIKTNDVIGHDRALQGGYGTIHPESVASQENLVFGWDNYQGTVWQYTNEGMQDVGKFGMKEYFRQKQLQIMAFGKENVRVYGEIDPFHNEYIISFVIDGVNDATLAYNFVENKWVTRYSYTPEMTCKINQLLVTFKSGNLWVHNKDTDHYNRFYGVDYVGLIKIASNPHPTKVKNAFGIQLSAEILTSSVDPDFKVIEIRTPEGQYSYLTPDEFDLLEKTYYASILKDANTLPALIPVGRLALRDGDDMKSKYFIIQFNEAIAPTKNSIQQINLTYGASEYSV